MIPDIFHIVMSIKNLKKINTIGVIGDNFGWKSNKFRKDFLIMMFSVLIGILTVSHL